MEIKFTVRPTITKHDNDVVFSGIVLEHDTVLSRNRKYPIMEQCKSIFGLHIFYAPKDDIELGSHGGKYVKIISNIAYGGNHPIFRPYKPGLKVTGNIRNDQFLITNINHNEPSVHTTKTQVE